MNTARPAATIARGALAVLLLSLLPGLATTQDSPTRAGYSPVLQCASCNAPADHAHTTSTPTLRR